MPPPPRQVLRFIDWDQHSRHRTHDRGGWCYNDGAFISTCICHACPFPTLRLNGKTAFEHYAAWYLGQTQGSKSMHIDTRPPNGGGELTDPLCAQF